MTNRVDPEAVEAAILRHPMTLSVAHTTVGRLIAIQTEVAGMSTALLAQRIEDLTARLMGDEPIPREMLLIHTVLQAEWKRRGKNVATL